MFEFKSDDRFCQQIIDRLFCLVFNLINLDTGYFFSSFCR